MQSVLQSISLAAPSVGRPAGRVSAQECRGPGSNPEFYNHNLGDLGPVTVSTGCMAGPEEKGFPRANLGTLGRKGSLHVTRPQSSGLEFTANPSWGSLSFRLLGGRDSQLSLVAGGLWVQLNRALAPLLSSSLALPASVCWECHQDGLPHSNKVAAGVPGFASVSLTGLS